MCNSNGSFKVEPLDPRVLFSATVGDWIQLTPGEAAAVVSMPAVRTPHGGFTVLSVDEVRRRGLSPFLGVKEPAPELSAQSVGAVDPLWVRVDAPLVQAGPREFRPPGGLTVLSVDEVRARRLSPFLTDSAPIQAPAEADPVATPEPTPLFVAAVQPPVTPAATGDSNWVRIDGSTHDFLQNADVKGLSVLSVDEVRARGLSPFLTPES